MITRIEIDKITAFEKLEVSFSSGLNVLIGENGTGKTHLMKLLYSAITYANSSESRRIEQLLHENFLPDTIGRLIKRTRGRKSGGFKVYSGDKKSLEVSLTTQNRVTADECSWRDENPPIAVYIPVKDMLANAPGFLSLYRDHSIHFEGVYADIISKALYPASRGRRNSLQKELLELIEAEIGGTIAVEGEKFYLKSRDGAGNLEFTLLAEGYRKLGLLFCLIQNERLSEGSILFWDEPEANLNPKLMQLEVKILYKLVEMGVKIFLSTHNSMLTSQIRLMEEIGPTSYHVFNKEADGEISYTNYNHLTDIEDNSIQEAYDTLLVQQIEKELNL